MRIYMLGLNPSIFISTLVRKLCQVSPQQKRRPEGFSFSRAFVRELEKSIYDLRSQNLTTYTCWQEEIQRRQMKNTHLWPAEANDEMATKEGPFTLSKYVQNNWQKNAAHPNIDLCYVQYRWLIYRQPRGPNSSTRIRKYFSFEADQQNANYEVRTIQENIYYVWYNSRRVFLACCK